MSAVTIPLMGRAPEIYTPDQLLSMSQMKQQMAGEAQMQPLRAQTAQLQIDDLQRKQGFGNDLARYGSEYDAKNPSAAVPASAPAPAATTPAAVAPAATPTPVAQSATPSSGDVTAYTPLSMLSPAAATPQPMSALAATPVGGASAQSVPAAGGPPSGAVNGISPIPTAAAASPQPLTAVNGAPAMTRDQYIAQRAAAEGKGDLYNAYAQNQAIAQTAQVTAQQKQQEMANEQALSGLIHDHQGDVDAALAQARIKGISPAYLNGIEQQIAATAKAKADAWTDTDSVQANKDGQVAMRLAAFRKKDPNTQAAQWDSFVSQLHGDGLIDTANLTALQKLHGDGNAPTTDQLDEYQSRLNAHVQMNQKAQTIAQTRAVTANTQATTASTQQQTDARTMTDTASRLAAALNNDDQNQFTAILTNLKAVNPTAAAQFEAMGPMFDAKGKQLPNKYDALERMAMTGEQQNTADRADATAEATSEYNTKLLGIQQQNANANLLRAERETTAGANKTANAVANRALTANGGDTDKAIAYLAKSTDEDDQAYMAQATKVLQALKNQAAKGKGGALDTRVASLMGGKSPATAATPQAKVNSSPGQITVRAGDGTLHIFPNEASAANFEANVKRLGGTTTRVTQPATK